ncbi:DUF397 domain-containing protein [Sphaerisporangium sp. NPDC051017]|uniref:DUF397 domain-containing protein n=1 Tax=Sphaerisporangium sp. NPDC051017 TaxID=3154636 RepID=UPI0034313B4B
MDRTNPLVWRKSSYSGGGSGSENCVEVAKLPGGGHALRDSKIPHSPVLATTPRGWTAFLDSVKNGLLG